MFLVVRLIGLVIAAGFVFACASTKPASQQKDFAFYLDPTALSVSNVIAPVPKIKSKQDQRDFEELLRLQRTRTDADCKRAEGEAETSLDHFFGPKYGILTEDQVQRWTPFFAHLRKQVAVFTQPAKQQYGRARPYDANPKVKPCIPREKNLAYPSGHAATSAVFAWTLASLDPSRMKVFFERADQIAQDRVLGGVHHPSDIAAGKELGSVIFKHLSSNPDFIRDLNALK